MSKSDGYLVTVPGSPIAVTRALATRAIHVLSLGHPANDALSTVDPNFIISTFFNLVKSSGFVEVRLLPRADDQGSCTSVLMDRLEAATARVNDDKLVDDLGCC